MNNDKRYVGVSGKMHDSISEAEASHYYAKFGFHACGDDTYYRHIFMDKEGTPFRAKPDFYNEDFDCYLEHKDAPLNGVKTKASADRQTESKMTYSRLKSGRKPSLIQLLRVQWNHSRHKQVIVQTKETPQRLIACFKKPPTYKEAKTYVKDGLVFIPMSALPSYKTYCKLAKAGLAVGFRLRYMDENGNEVVWEL